MSKSQNNEVKTCGNCMNAWGTGTILYCYRHKNRAVYVTETCGSHSPIELKNYVRPELVPPTIVFDKALKFSIDPQDNFLLEQSIKYVSTYPGPLRVVLDIGAHVGTFSMYCAKRGATVYAYEPSVFNFAYLDANVYVNQEDIKGKVNTYNLAVTESTGETLLLRRAGIGTGQRSVDYDEDKWPVDNEVTTISLKDLLKEVFEREGFIDYLKCDIEGTEFRFTEMDEETRNLVGRVGYVEMSIHPLDNLEYFGEEVGVDYTKKMKDWLKSCGLDETRYILC